MQFDDKCSWASGWLSPYGSWFIPLCLSISQHSSNAINVKCSIERDNLRMRLYHQPRFLVSSLYNVGKWWAPTTIDCTRCTAYKNLGGQPALYLPYGSKFCRLIISDSIRTLWNQDISAPCVWCRSVSDFYGGAEMSWVRSVHTPYQTWGYGVLKWNSCMVFSRLSSRMSSIS